MNSPSSTCSESCLTAWTAPNDLLTLSRPTAAPIWHLRLSGNPGPFIVANRAQFAPLISFQISLYFSRRGISSHSMASLTRSGPSSM